MKKNKGCPGRVLNTKLEIKFKRIEKPIKTRSEIKRTCKEIRESIVITNLLRNPPQHIESIRLTYHLKILSKGGKAMMLSYADRKESSA